MSGSIDSPRFGRDSRHSSILKNKKNSMLITKNYNDELELAQASNQIKKIFDKRKRYFSFNDSSNSSVHSGSHK